MMYRSVHYGSRTLLGLVLGTVALGCGSSSDAGSTPAPGAGGASSTSSALGGKSAAAGANATGASQATGGSSNAVSSTAAAGTTLASAAGGTTPSSGGATTSTTRGTINAVGGIVNGAAGSNGSVGGAAMTGGTSTNAATTTPATGGSATTTAAAAGVAGQAFVDNSLIVQSPSGIVDKMDILFDIDNSLSMGDKQQVLATAVPQLLRRLTNPDCVDAKPGSTTQPVPMPDPTTPCPTGLEREFSPIKDIHIGVVTSSLGAFGGDTCPTEGAQNTAQNDRAWLLGALPRTNGTLPTFLSWTKSDAAAYPTSIEPRLTEFKNLVAAATELGCGNEMTLEAWYRFLVDPKPPTDVTTTNSTANVRGPIDNAILNQRKAFLRPDSLVAVVMLSDENDCSMRDNTYSWVTMMASGGFRMWRGSKVCATNPNDPCCYSCMLDSLASEACKALDPTCRQNEADARLSIAADDINMRCRSMKRRFGYDFLFPTSRYVNALTKLQLCPDQDYGDLDCDCTEAKAKGVACNPGLAVANPLYQNLEPNYVPTGPVRLDASSVFLAGIVGVPWQDLATDDALSPAATLKYRLATELNWDLFAPRDDLTAPLDPLMIEQSAARTGTHPITKEPLAPPEAMRMANGINGHEWLTSDKDVQFACIFSLDQPIAGGTASATRTCDLTAACGAQSDTDEYKICARRFDGCSCTLSSDPSRKSPNDPTVSLSPLCQAPNGTYGSTQYYAKAYPGLRELQVLRGFFDVSAYSRNNAIAASICPKDLNYANAASSGYGYNPAMRALVDRLKDNIGGTCLPQPLVAETGTDQLPCSLIEAITPDGAAEGSCDCAAKQRDPVDTETQQSMRAILEHRGTCDGSGCDKFCFCRLRQLMPGTTAGDACLNNLDATRTTNPPGFCYVDPPNHGNPALVGDCDANEKRTIRIVGNDALGLKAPAKGPVFYTCSTGSPYVGGIVNSP